MWIRGKKWRNSCGSRLYSEKDLEKKMIIKSAFLGFKKCLDNVSQELVCHWFRPMLYWNTAMWVTLLYRSTEQSQSTRCRKSPSFEVRTQVHYAPTSLHCACFQYQMIFNRRQLVPCADDEVMFA